MAMSIPPTTTKAKAYGSMLKILILPATGYTTDLGRRLNPAEKRLLRDARLEYQKLRKLPTASDADEQTKLAHMAAWKTLRTDLQKNEGHMWESLAAKGAQLRLQVWTSAARPFRKRMEQALLMNAIGLLSAPIG